MNSLKSTHRLLMTPLVLLGFFLVAGAAQAGEMVPLKGSFVGSGFFFDGNFTHLGRFDGEVTGAGTATWTAANGDTVDNQTLSFVVGDPAGTTADGVDLFTYTQTLAIVGGTGRFVDATGLATVEGMTTLDFSFYDGYLTGTISKPNSGN